MRASSSVSDRQKGPRKSKTVPVAIVHECGRCGATHHGAKPGPGWSDHPDYGKLCDACSETVELRTKLGLAA